MMKNPNAAANLKKKGAAANPNGAPMHWETHAELYKKYSLMPIEKLQNLDLTKLPIKHTIIINDLRKASQGKDRAIDRYQNRTDGKSVENVDLTTKGQKLGGISDDVLNKIDLMHEKNNSKD